MTSQQRSVCLPGRRKNFEILGIKGKKEGSIELTSVIVPQLSPPCSAKSRSPSEVGRNDF